MNPFKKKVDIKGQVKQSETSIRKGVRDVEKELRALEIEEKKVLQQTTAAAKNGRKNEARILAQSLVRVRQQKAKLIQAVARLKGMSTTIKTSAVTNTVTSAMKAGADAMKATGATINPKKVQKDVMAFSQENAKADLAQDMMDDAIDSALSMDEIEDEADEYMNQVLDEIGVELSSQLASANPPKAKVGASQKSKPEVEAEELLKKLGVLN